MLAYTALLEKQLLPVVLPHSWFRMTFFTVTKPWFWFASWILFFSWIWSFLEECLREHWIVFSRPKNSLPSTTSEKWEHRYTKMPRSTKIFCQIDWEQLRFPLEIHLLPWLPLYLIFLHLFINWVFLKFSYKNILNSSSTRVLL